MFPHDSSSTCCCISLSVAGAMYLKCAIICTQMCDTADGPTGLAIKRGCNQHSPSQNICPRGVLANSLERVCVCECVYEYVCLYECVWVFNEDNSSQKLAMLRRCETDTKDMDVNVNLDVNVNVNVEMHAHLQTPLIATANGAQAHTHTHTDTKLSFWPVGNVSIISWC